MMGLRFFSILMYVRIVNDSSHHTMIRTLSIKPENKFCFYKLLDSRKLLSAYISVEKEVLLLYRRIL